MERRSGVSFSQVFLQMITQQMRCGKSHLRCSRSYMYLSLGSIAVVFALGAISIWGPQYVVLSRKIQDDTSSSVLK